MKRIFITLKGINQEKIVIDPNTIIGFREKASGTSIVLNNGLEIPIDGKATDVLNKLEQLPIGNTPGIEIF